MGGRLALYSGYQSSRNVFPGASKTTAKYSLGKSERSRRSMLTTPRIAPVGSPSELVNDGIAWKARKRYDEPSTRTMVGESAMIMHARSGAMIDRIPAPRILRPRAGRYRRAGIRIGRRGSGSSTAPARDENRHQPDHRAAADGCGRRLVALVPENAGGRQRGKRNPEGIFLPASAVRGSFPDREPAGLPGIGLLDLRHPQDPFRRARKCVVVSAQNFRWRQRPGNPQLLQDLRGYELGRPFGSLRTNGAHARGWARLLPPRGARTIPTHGGPSRRRRGCTFLPDPRSLRDAPRPSRPGRSAHNDPGPGTGP